MVSVTSPVDAVKLNVPVPLCGGTENGIVVVKTVWEVKVDRDLVVYTMVLVDVAVKTDVLEYTIVDSDRVMFTVKKETVVESEILKLPKTSAALVVAGLVDGADVIDFVDDGSTELVEVLGPVGAGKRGSDVDSCGDEDKVEWSVEVALVTEDDGTEVEEDEPSIEEDEEENEDEDEDENEDEEEEE